MSKAVIVVILGFIVALIPFDGLPERVSTILLVVIGLVVMFLGLLLRAERLWLLRSLSGGHKTDAYAENGAPPKTEEQKV